MRIAIIGTRGIPANYGGFETFAEVLALRLTDLGHQVTVYCRSGNSDRYRDHYRGVRLVTLPALRFKYLETVSHTFLASLHAFLHPVDICLYCNAANALFMALPRLRGQRVCINVDGIERKRAKWNFLGRSWYLLGEYLSTVLAHRVVADAEVIADYYRQRYRIEPALIPYGATPKCRLSRQALDRFGLEPDSYFLYVSRLEPENNAHRVIAAFERVQTDKRLVIVGDAPYAREYIQRLKATTDPRILFTGYVFGQGYEELQSHCFAYIHATEVGGTHPALLEGMAMAPCVVANGTPENIEVLGDGGLLYKKNDVADLARCLRQLLERPAIRQPLQQAAIQRIRHHYSWEAVVNAYLDLFHRCLAS